MKKQMVVLFTLVALALQADVDLAGSWTVLGKGLKGSCLLPGTLADAKLGTKWTYEDFLKRSDRPQSGALVREYQYLGKARYARTITLSAQECAHPLELFLERVMWASRAFLDGRALGPEAGIDLLSSPHVYSIPAALATPGEHRLEIEVDNSCRYGFSRFSHSYGPVMQSVWHGILGRMEIRAAHPLRTTRVFASAPANGRLRLDLPAGFDALSPDAVTIPGLSITGIRRVEEPAAPGRQTVELRLATEPAYWSEHHPSLYTLVLFDRAADFTQRIRFGFRTIKADRKTHAISVNGHRTFLRATLDCCNFAKTGAPATTKDEWLEIFRKLKCEDGLNAVRFHSWTPPAAAFAAADEIGLYLLPEADIWTDGWMGDARAWKQGKSGANGVQQVGWGLPVDGYVLRAFDAILANYGNSPSFLSLAIGNELGGANFAVCGEWMKALKAKDPRHFYFVSTAREVTAGDDIEVTHAIPGVGSCRTHLEAGTDWDYENVYSRGRVPVLSHEIGQWPVYPMWEELGKYTGVLKPFNIEQYRRVAEKNGVLAFNRRYHEASAQLSRLLYKDEVESYLRTPSCAGCELLGVQDFTGQGEALIGWRDPFYDLKRAYGSGTPFASIWGATNYLARLSKYVWTADETLSARLQIRNLSEAALPAGMKVRVTFNGKAEEVALQSAIPAGALGDVCTFTRPLGAVLGERKSARVTLAFGSNSWNIWVYPAREPVAPVPANVVETDRFAVAKKALADGRTVLFTGKTRTSTVTRFRSVYWSANWFPSRDKLGAALGSWYDAAHPALRGFATEKVVDWQWYHLLNGAKLYDLTALPRTLEPIAGSVNDFHFNIPAASMFEARVGKGVVFVCGFDLTKTDPASKRLRASVMAYLARGAFGRVQAVTPEALEAVLGAKEMGAPGAVAVPAEYAAAPLYIAASTGLKARNRNFDWDRARDGAKLPAGVAYTVEALSSHFGAWADADGSYWFGKKMKITITGMDPVQGEIRIRFRDPNANNRTGRGIFEGTAFEVPHHQQQPNGIWWAKLPVIRENFLDGKLELTVEALTGPNLMIDRLVVMPK